MTAILLHCPTLGIQGIFLISLTNNSLKLGDKPLLKPVNVEIYIGTKNEGWQVPKQDMDALPSSANFKSGGKALASWSRVRRVMFQGGARQPLGGAQNSLLVPCMINDVQNWRSKRIVIACLIYFQHYYFYKRYIQVSLQIIDSLRNRHSINYILLSIL